MEIKHIRDNDTQILKLIGRLDAYWSDHLRDEVDKCVRSGVYRIKLDMAGVNYLSSAGIRVLLQIYKQANDINGEFSLINISENVRSVLKLSGIVQLLKTEEYDSSETKIDSGGVGKIESSSATFQLFKSDSTKILKYELHGTPDLLSESNFTNASSHSLIVNQDTYSIGIGAFGSDYDECKDKYGEFIAMCGGATYLPTDGSNTPDFQIVSGSFLPKVNSLYAIECRGEFGYMSRFESRLEKGNITLKELIDCCFQISGHDELGLAIVAETAGIVGANLIKSPVLGGSDKGILRFPEIQDCISFTSEKSYNGSLVALFGIISRRDDRDIKKFMRPYGKDQTFAHIHAAVFSYQPLMKGMIDLKDTIYSLYEKQSLFSVIHLLFDDREIIGVGDTELIRGAVWLAPLDYK